MIDAAIWNAIARAVEALLLPRESTSPLSIGICNKAGLVILIGGKNSDFCCLAESCEKAKAAFCLMLTGRATTLPTSSKHAETVPLKEEAIVHPRAANLKDKDSLR
jgi:hypothetical protein